jgi:hypothetical protein
MAAPQEIQTYPRPPGHYMQFASGPTALQPPDIGGLGPTYRMFGRVVQNPSKCDNAQFPPPPIDRDVLVYDSKQPIKPQLIGLVDSLSDSVLNLLEAVQNNPTDTGSEQRKLDNTVKSIFHALECLRSHEARQVLVRMSEREIEMRQSANDKARQVVENAKLLLG